MYGVARGTYVTHTIPSIQLLPQELLFPALELNNAGGALRNGMQVIAQLPWDGKDALPAACPTKNAPF